MGPRVLCLTAYRAAAGRVFNIAIYNLLVHSQIKLVVERATEMDPL
ncbi:hypothetical protein BN903_172 [Halorubrum sp. AJ67]|nr:hypothetical protein BN903_172 [Halorubrum sp. AJ67]